MNEITDRIGRLFMIGLPGPSLDDETKTVLDEMDPLSVILFGRNIESAEQLAKYIADITAHLGRKPVFAIDQEGGIVTRLTKGFTVVPGPMALAAAGEPSAAYDAGRILGAEMKAVGIDWDLAPVVDVNRNPSNRGIGVRSFSADTAEVVRYAGRFVEGLSDSGVLCCLKHFPGLGAVEADPHIDLPVLGCSREELFGKDLPPFLGIEADCWMPTHVWVPAIQSRKEAVTVSSEVLTGFVRDELGFDGLLLADDLNMGGVAGSFSPGELVVRTFSAGMDILSIAEGSEVQMTAKRAFAAAVEGSSHLQARLEESLGRIDRILCRYEGDLVQEPGSLRLPENTARAAEISRSSVRLVKSAAPLPPLSDVDNVFAMKSARLVLVEDAGGGYPDAAVRTAEAAGCRLQEVVRAGEPSDYELLLAQAEGGVNLIFTENAHLDEAVSEFVGRLAKASDYLSLIALRNPWDADIRGIGNAVCSYGYTPDQQAAVFSILNKEQPSGGE